MRIHDAPKLALLSTLALVGCPAPATRTADTTTSGDETEAESEDDARDLDRPNLRRVGAIAPGDYRFELEGEGGVERRTARLESMSGDELRLRVDGRLVRTSRQSTWPILCLTRPIAFTDGALRVRLATGASVYVIASDVDAVRIGPFPGERGARIVDRSAVSLEGCDDTAPAASAQGVAQPPAGDAACLFSDQDPADESEGLPVPAGAGLEVLEDEGEWSLVRVARAGGSLEGWIAAELVARATESPDWSGAALHPGRCAFPGRASGTVQSRAYLESSDGDLPAPSNELFDPALDAAEPRIRACLDDLPADQRPTVRARVEIRMVLDGDGQVSSVTVVRAEGAPPTLSRCIAERARRVRFPAPRTSVTIRRSYTFEAPRAPAATEPVEGEDDGLEEE